VDVQFLPTLDGRGRLYDVGTGKQDEDVLRPGNRRKKPEKVSHRGCDSTLVLTTSLRPVIETAICYGTIKMTMISHSASWCDKRNSGLDRRIRRI
jgi:hypothetical protein